MSLSILPLNANKSGKFIPWMIALMVYLATITGLGAVSISQWAAKWQLGFNNSITIELPPIGPQAQPEKLREVLSFLKKQPSVSHVKVVDKEKISELLRPWLGSEFSAKNLPLPILIDCSVSRNGPTDLAALKAGLTRIYPDASIEDNSKWHTTIDKFANSVQWALVIMLGLILLTVIGSINFITRTGLTIHAELISILQLLGARDDYVAGQFQKFVMQLGLRGCFLGMVLTLGTSFFLYFYAQGMEGFLQPDYKISILHLGVFFMTPAMIVLFMVVATRRTVMNTLKTQLPT